jgi:hypothetical protein
MQVAALAKVEADTLNLPIKPDVVELGTHPEKGELLERCMPCILKNHTLCLISEFNESCCLELCPAIREVNEVPGTF